MSDPQLLETITICLYEAFSDSYEERQRALQILDSITKVNPQNRTLLGHTDGAIAALIELSKSSSPIIETLSLSILFNLSLNSGLKRSLADMETIYHLNSMILSSSSPESSRLVSSLVCSLAMHDKNKAKFGVAGTIPLLVKAVAGPRGPAAHHLLSSLAELVQYHGNCTVAVRSGAIPVLLRIVESADTQDIAGTALSILCLLVRFEEGLNALRQTDEILSLMVNVLKGTSMLSKEGAAEILLRLFDESDECVRDALSVPHFSSVLADLSVRGSAKAREKAGLLMRKTVLADVDCYSDGKSVASLPW